MESTLQSRLREARDEANLTQSQLAERAGVKQSTISALENKEGTGTKYIARIAQILGVNAYWLETGQEPKRPSGLILSPEELQVIEIWRGFPLEVKKVMLAQWKGALSAIQSPQLEQS